MTGLPRFLVPRTALLQGLLVCGLGFLDACLTGGPGVMCVLVGLFAGALLSFRSSLGTREQLPQLALRIAVHHAVMGGALYGVLVELPIWWAPGAIGLLAGVSGLILTMVAGDAALHWFGPREPQRLPPAALR